MDSKITALPPAVVANLTDLLAKVNDPSGVPVTQKVTLEQVQILMREIIMLAGQVGLTITAPAVPVENAILYQDSGLTALFTVDKDGYVTTPSSVEVTTTPGTAGFILRSLNGTRWRLTVSNLGVPSAALA